MRMNTEGEEAQAVAKVMLPDGLVPFEEPLSAPYVVDEDIETALLCPDAVDQSLDLVRDEMIDPDGYALPAGCRDQFGRFLDGFGAGVFGLMIARRSTGHVDRCTGGAQLHGDAPTRAARCASDQGDFTFKR